MENKIDELEVKVVDVELFAEEDDLFFDELDERYNNSASAISTISTISSYGACICTIGCACSAEA